MRNVNPWNPWMSRFRSARAPLAANRLRVIALLCLAAGACAAPPRMLEEPRLSRCRLVVDAKSALVNADLRWFSPAHPPDRRAHAEWCGTVGPVVIAPMPGAGRRRHASGPDDLAIVTWNTHVGGGDLPAFVRDLRGGRWSGGIPVGDFVLLLQEVFRDGPEVPEPTGVSPPVPDAIVPPAPPSGRLDIVDAAERLGLSLFYAPSMRNGAGVARAAEDRGSAILSTLPLSGFRVIELPFERQRRVAVAASVAMPGARQGRVLHVISVHLDSRGARRRLVVLSPAARRRQARGLIAALPRDGAAVVGGDLNTWLWGREGAVLELRRALPDPPGGGGSTYGSLRLDYLFFRLAPGWTASSRVLDEAYGSDHRPVAAWLRTSGAPVPPAGEPARP